MVKLFLDECPRLLSTIREAVASRDPKAVEYAAHALKGSVGNFSAQPAFEAALKLEMMGRQGDLTHVEEASRGLEEALERLKPELTVLGGALEG